MLNKRVPRLDRGTLSKAMQETRLSTWVKTAVACGGFYLVSQNGGAILRVQTLRNVWRGFKAELIDTTVAPQGIYPATLEDVQAEIESHQAVIAKGLVDMLGEAVEYRKQPPC